MGTETQEALSKADALIDQPAVCHYHTQSGASALRHFILAAANLIRHVPAHLCNLITN